MPPDPPAALATALRLTYRQLIQVLPQAPGFYKPSTDLTSSGVSVAQKRPHLRIVLLFDVRLGVLPVVTRTRLFHLHFALRLAPVQ